MNRRVRRYLNWLGSLALLGLLVFALIRYFHVRHFAAVEPGRLYRSGQPGGSDWARLQGRYHVKTVINLRDAGERDADLEEEPRALARLGIRYVTIPLPSAGTPTPEQTDQFLQVVTDPANWPVLVHCKRGRDRTGVMSAIYRIRVDHWSADQAADELAVLHDGKEEAEYRAFLHDYARRTAELGDIHHHAGRDAAPPKG